MLHAPGLCVACLIDGGFIFPAPSFLCSLYCTIHRQMLETDHANACICSCSCRAAGDAGTVLPAEPDSSLCTAS